MIKSYRDLIVWKTAYALTIEIYRATQFFPKHELFGLVSQLRRSAISIASNIAEGNYRRSTKEYKYFLSVARASCAEFDTQIEISKDLRYITFDQYKKLAQTSESISKMLFAIYSKLP